MLFKKFNLLGTEVVFPVLCNEQGVPIIDKNKKYNEKGYIPDFNHVNKIVNTSTTKNDNNKFKIENRKHNNVMDLKNQPEQKLELNISEWKEFKVGNIFKKLDIEKFNKEPEEGTLCNFVSASGLNNGVVKKVNKKSFDKPCLTITTDGACFDVFYQKTPIAVSSNVEVLYSEVLNEYNALFIATILKMEQFKWSYGRKPKNDKVFKTYIKLPIKKDINNIPYIDEEKTYSEIGFVPDWKFMENYIKSLNCEIPKTKNFTIPDINLDVVKWKEFKIKDLFTLENAKCTNAANLLIDGNDVNYIGAKKTENGVMRRVVCNKELISKGNCIAFIGQGAGSAGYATYQPIDFIGGSTLTLGYSNFLTKEIALFMVAIIDLERFKYSFGRSFKGPRLEKTVIKLPIKRNPDGIPYIDKEKKYSKEGYVPDWEFIENYIKSFPYGDVI